MLINNVSGWCYYLQGTLYTGLADGRIVKLEGDKVVDVVRTGKTPCGKYDFTVKYYSLQIVVCSHVENAKFSLFSQFSPFYNFN